MLKRWLFNRKILKPPKNHYQWGINWGPWFFGLVKFDVKDKP